MPGLSYEQGAGIVSRLKKNRKYSLFVTCEGEDSDALSYANDLTQALREGGWEVSGPCASSGRVPVPGSWLALMISPALTRAPASWSMF